ncbi:hypothetical protein SAMN04487897_10628 [Paenibacillus sp. yr247]|nr:hypothetical protein SAMN04487897_10628 [Paenibacillus sp. yr247]
MIEANKQSIKVLRICEKSVFSIFVMVSSILLAIYLIGLTAMLEDGI